MLKWQAWCFVLLIKICGWCCMFLNVLFVYDPQWLFSLNNVWIQIKASVLVKIPQRLSKVDHVYEIQCPYFAPSVHKILLQN